MGFGKGKIIFGCLKTGHAVLLIAYCLSLIAVFTGCGRRGDPVLVPSYEEKIIKEDSDKKKEEEKAKSEVPAHVTVFDPEKPPFETLHLCIYLRELEEEKEKEELEKSADPALHK